MILSALALALLSYLTWSLIALELNYRRALTMRIPLVRLPIDPLNILFQVFEPHVWNLIDFLRIPQSWLPTWTRYARRGWHFSDKAASHLKYGPIWALVTPRDVHILLSEKEAVHDVFVRRNAFVRPSKIYKLLEVYGPCISTADQANWPRHRKILAAPFNENVMSFVWNESLQQASELLSSWGQRDLVANGVPSVARDSRILSLNVMAAIGFQRRFAFESSADPEGVEFDEGKMFDYRDALQIVLENSILLMLVSPKHVVYSWLPKKLRRIAKAATDFKAHMERMLDEERAALKRGESGSGSLMTSFVRALDAHARNEDKTDSTGSKQGLSRDEIFGNTFVINFAGHDTTANTLAFTMFYLAIYPEVQEWIGEEIRRVTGSKKLEECDYTTVFPKLKRCRAILLETLRLHPPILALPKWTTSRPEHLRLGDRTIVIPPYSGISPTVMASHTMPEYWADPLTWKPSRWIIQDPSPPSASSSSCSASHSEESMYVPPDGMYYPWSDGPQNCLGARFSQVEFVAVLARIFGDHRVEVVPNSDEESDERILKRVTEVLEDCDFQMLLRMRNPDRVRLRCRRVGDGSKQQ